MAIAKYNQIFIDGKWRTYQPYAYSNGIWHKALTNIYTNGEWQEIPEIPWVLWDNTQGGQTDENTEWVKAKFSTLSGGIDATANTNISNSKLHVYQDNMVTGNWYGGNWSTSTTVLVPNTAKTLKVTYNKASSSSGVARANISLILPTAKNAFDTSGGGLGITQSGNTMSGSTVYTLTLNLSEEIKGTDKFVVSLTGWMQNNASYPNTRGDVYFNKVWFE